MKIPACQYPTIEQFTAASLDLEIRTRPDLWERVYAIRDNGDGTYWVRTYNYTYPRVAMANLRNT